LSKCGKSAAIISMRQAIKCPDNGRRVKLEQRNKEKGFGRLSGDKKHFCKNGVKTFE
jgi:hypothetical protein